jgi:hypothetical protein
MEFEASFSLDLMILIQQCLIYDQARRLSAKRMKSHPWFDSYLEELRAKGQAL